jgi:hypothetical protein
VLEAAVETAPGGDSPTRARLLANLAGELVFSTDNQRRERLAADALAIARRLDDAPTLAHVLAHRIPTLVQTVPADLFACVEELSAVATRVGDPVLAFLSAWWGSITALTVCDTRGARDRLDAAARLAGELRQPFFPWATGFLRSNLSRVAGDLDSGEAQALEAFEIGHAAQIPDAFRVLGVNLLWVRHDQGRLDEVVDPLLRAAARERPPALASAALSLVLSALDRHPQARQVIDTLAPGDFAALPAASVWLYSLTLVAGACAAVRDLERAAILYERMRPFGGLVAQCGAGSTGTVDHHLGLLAGVLGRGDEAEEHFAQARALNDRIGAPIWQRQTRRAAALVVGAG